MDPYGLPRHIDYRPKPTPVLSRPSVQKGIGAMTGLGALGGLAGSWVGDKIGGLFGEKGKKIGSDIGGAIGGTAGAIGGGLLRFKKGGHIKKTGKAILHKGEFVLPKGIKPTKSQIIKVRRKKGLGLRNRK